MMQKRKVTRGSNTLSLAEARRVAIASQGFGTRPARPGLAHVRALAARVQAFQIDSVNVLTRAHYVPAFARLGPYPSETIDTLTYRRRELFEYWGHAACLLPIALYPLIRYRMDRHTECTLAYMRSARGKTMAKAYAEVAERGPLTASELSHKGSRAKGWWGWLGSDNAKSILEHLYDAGLVAIAGRRGFERVYDLAERVIPRDALDAPAPPREEAMKQLICLGARASGVGTLTDIVDYLNIDGWQDRNPAGPHWEWPTGKGRRSKPIAKRLVSELVEEGRLLPASVEGWNERAYLHPNTRVPRQDVDARAIVTPFDSLVWNRERIARLFGMQYSIEIYTPAHKRVYGYYVCPVLIGETLVARVDLKADRSRSVLMVRSAFLEPGQQARRVAPPLLVELQQMQAWLQLDRIEVANRGDLASALARSFRRRR